MAAPNFVTSNGSRRSYELVETIEEIDKLQPKDARWFAIELVTWPDLKANTPCYVFSACSTLAKLFSGMPYFDISSFEERMEVMEQKRNPLKPGIILF